MWIYPAHLGILIPRGLRPITPCPPPLLGQRVVIAILRSGSEGRILGAFVFLTFLYLQFVALPSC